MKVPRRFDTVRRDVGQIRSRIGAHLGDDFWEHAGLHIGSVVVEELQGTIDGVNTIFQSSYVPRTDTTFQPILFLRGLGYIYGSATRSYFAQAGRDWWLVTPPRAIAAGDVFDDMPPFAIYLRTPGAAEPAYDPVAMAEPIFGLPEAALHGWWEDIPPGLI